jgi:short-subunit dehydrogenase
MTIIITGASDGLGAALARECVSAGFGVVNISKSVSKLGGVENVIADLSTEAGITAAAKTIKEKHAKFDAFVNCAGVFTQEAADKITYAEIERVFKINTFAPIFLTSRLFDLIKQNGADILNVITTVAHKAYAEHAVYGASKWALRGATENLRLELQKTPCRVISVCPGGMATDFHKKFNGEVCLPPEWMKPEEIAKLIFTILTTPKQIEISEMIINRKKAAK